MTHRQQNDVMRKSSKELEFGTIKKHLRLIYKLTFDEGARNEEKQVIYFYFNVNHFSCGRWDLVVYAFKDNSK